jgi:uncharacterized protein (DUF433 family)
MKPEIQNPLESVTNILYLIRAKVKSEPIAALAYPYLADQQIQRLIRLLDKYPQP